MLQRLKYGSSRRLGSYLFSIAFSSTATGSTATGGFFANLGVVVFATLSWCAWYQLRCTRLVQYSLKAPPVSKR